jgi:formate hydrogenlyase subunit 6/NADH:ubiquinone oxidoreductase subunit I
MSHKIPAQVVIESERLDRLIQALTQKDYQVVGPTIRESAIVYDTLTSIKDLPIGWTDEQEGGTYRLKKRGDRAYFGYVVGPHSWKKFLNPPVMKLWEAKRDQPGFHFIPEKSEHPKYAFLGVRSCDLHAIFIQDQVFKDGNYVDPTYKVRRENALIIAVNCGQAGGTCFCVSMKTGPKAAFGFDLALTEILESDRHYFLVEIGTDLGRDVLAEVPHETASNEDIAKGERIVAHTATQMGRSMETSDIKELLYRNLEHSRWDNVASRCLTCANCTMVCPTCFCSTVEDVTDLKGEHTERWRKWDSCFTMDFSYIYGGSVRPTTKSRYRQWMTHKLATWIDQFGTSGCVGCGRCITWCPVAIDITEEVRAIRESEKRGET